DRVPMGGPVWRQGADGRAARPPTGPLALALPTPGSLHSWGYDRREQAVVEALVSLTLDDADQSRRARVAPSQAFYRTALGPRTRSRTALARGILRAVNAGPLGAAGALTAGFRSLIIRAGRSGGMPDRRPKRDDPAIFRILQAEDDP